MFCCTRYTLLLACFLAAILVVPALFAQVPRFLDAPEYPSLAFPDTAIAGDFNGDGKVDIVEAGQGIGFFPGNGDGTFGVRKDSPFTRGPAATSTGDFNRDGKLDLVIADFRDDISIVLGKGDGTFQNNVDYPAGAHPNGVAVADFNNDGILDIAESDLASINVFIGNPDGTFQPFTSYAAGVNPRSVVVGDFNQDGKSDLAVLNHVSLSVVLGNGNGTFGPPVAFTTDSGPEYMAVVDLNGDQIPDLAVSASSSNKADVFIGKGDGTFFPRQAFATQEDPGRVVAGDFDGDHKPDLAVSGHAVSLLLGNGDGTLQPELEFGAGIGAGALAVGNFNQDGTTDLATAIGYFDKNSVFILLGNKDGTLRARRENETGRGSYTTAAGVAVGDFNNDGRLDLASTNSGDNVLSVMLGNGDTSFQPHLDSPTGSTPLALHTGDFNGDGNLDVAVANYYNDQTISVLMGNGNGTFHPKVNYVVGESPSSVGVGDFDGDQKPDLAIAIQAANEVAILLNRGDGTFASATFYMTGPGPVSVAVGDVNGDGKPDLVTANMDETQLSDPVSLLLGNGDGTFQHQVSIGQNLGSPAAVAIADFNNDSKPDIGMTQSGGAVNVFLGNGDGSFQQSPITTSSGQYSNYMAVDDFNADGKLDVAVTHGYFFEGETVSVLLGQGDGSFQGHTDFEVAYQPISVAIADFNADGAPDLAVANYQTSTLSVLPNTGGTFLTLSSSVNPSHVGESVTFTLIVREGLPGTGTPSGRVSFYEGTTLLGTATLASRRARFSTVGLSAGTHQIRAFYVGNEHFNRHKSDVLVQQVLP
ncbi:MAG TPA: FG-GAP-like repeat-containing protein [Terriglobales bacterium]